MSKKWINNVELLVANKGFVRLPKRWVVARVSPGLAAFGAWLVTRVPIGRAVYHGGRFALCRLCHPDAFTGRSSLVKCITRSKSIAKQQLQAHVFG
jgi:hypothetical protein